jgi:hypothetical protein
MKGANPRADCDSVSARGGRDRTPLKNQELASAAVADLGSRFRQDILTWCFVRTHMSLIVSGTISSGLLATTLMHLLGVQSMAVRYPLAVLASYLGFFGLPGPGAWRERLACAGGPLGRDGWAEARMVTGDLAGP